MDRPKRQDSRFITCKNKDVRPCHEDRQWLLDDQVTDMHTFRRYRRCRESLMSLTGRAASAKVNERWTDGRC